MVEGIEIGLINRLSPISLVVVSRLFAYDFYLISRWIELILESMTGYYLPSGASIVNLSLIFYHLIKVPLIHMVVSSFRYWS